MTSMPLDYASVPLIEDAISYFKADNLRVSEADFRRTLDAYVSNEIRIEEQDPGHGQDSRQRHSFFWGHDHDFGTFKLSGEMGTRHIWMLSRFFDHFGVDPRWLNGKQVLDVGCWTGGVSLVLNRLGAEVTAVDVLRKYARSLSYLADAFGLEQFSAVAMSLYDLDRAEFAGRFDAVFCLGVVYHLSDPIVGLRRLFHALKPAGMLLIETMSVPTQECICEYEGPSRRHGNWFVPSPRALYQWLEDSGFGHIQVGNGVEEFQVTREGDPMGPNRCFAVSRKVSDHYMSTTRLSVDIR